DPKIEVLSEINNMYRAFYSMFLILFIASLFSFPEFGKVKITISGTLFFAFIIYTLSYKKQTNFISLRVVKSR
ncbi:hypothetical protein, partial [Serratia marcescens]|uniref:hypothetical protein n=1 Tax=Serratia marcescens TaxID=615 RepID=UPI003171AFDB